MTKAHSDGQEPVSIPTAQPQGRFWCSWYGASGTFELHSPWWVSGWRCSDDAETICAAVIASDEEAAASIIRAAHDDALAAIEWRFINPREADWEPFCDRFPRAKWMIWPEVTTASAVGTEPGTGGVHKDQPGAQQ